VGVTEFDAENAYAPSEIIREADRALFKSKETGRNKVTVSAPRLS
jgi:PleD family two-component response regulator